MVLSFFNSLFEENKGEGNVVIKCSELFVSICLTKKYDRLIC